MPGLGRGGAEVSDGMLPALAAVGRRPEAKAEVGEDDAIGGLDWSGLDWIGLDWIGLDWVGLGWVGFGLCGVQVCAAAGWFACVSLLLLMVCVVLSGSSGPFPSSFSVPPRA